MKRVKVTSDGTTVGTLVEVDGELLPGVVRAEVILRGDDVPQIVLVLDGLDVDLEIVTRKVCGASHPTAEGVTCLSEPHGSGDSHIGAGYVWRDQR